MKNNVEKEIRRIQGLVGEYSFTVVLPKKYATNIGISKGDYVEITENQDAIVIRKAWRDESEK
jgi:antitoxin component of MazEF toxin-antitoxin module